MPRRKQTRLPFEPLPDYLRNTNGYEFTSREIMDALEIDNYQLQNYRKRGITINRADWLAVHRLNTHPANIWGEQFYEPKYDADNEPASLPTTRVLDIYHAPKDWSYKQAATHFEVDYHTVRRIWLGAAYKEITGGKPRPYAFNYQAARRKTAA